MYINDNRQNNILHKKAFYKIIYINKMHIKNYKLYFKNLIQKLTMKNNETDIKKVNFKFYFDEFTK